MASVATGVYSGSDHTLALKTDGSLWTAGYNGYGQLGNGTTQDRWTLAQITNISGVSAVAAGAYHSLAVTSDTGLWAWGYNAYGQLGDGSTTGQTRPKLILYNVAEVAAGWRHTLALKTDGSVWAWGYNGYGQLGDGTSGNSRSSPVSVMAGVTAIAAGQSHSLALKTDSSLWAWGYNGYGQLGDNTTWDRTRPVQVLTGVIAMSAGRNYTLALKNDGTLWACGYNSSGELGDNTQTTRLNPVQVLTDVAAITGGGNHSIARKTDGSLWAWGYNGYGQLGDGTTTQRLLPVPVQGFTPALPTAPSNLLASAVSTAQINLTWSDNSSNEQGFRIERQEGSGGWSQIATTGPDVTSFANTALNSGTTYSYRIVAYNAAGNSGYSNTATTTTTPIPPTPPTNLTAAAISSGQINLNWTDNSSNEQGFRIERQEGTGGWSQIGTTGPDITSFANTALNSGTTYSYRVVAYNSTGSSGYSNTASATTLPSVTVPTAPTNLNATAASSTQINLTWSDNSSNEQGFRIERRHNTGNWAVIATVGQNAAGYANSGLNSGTTYYYRVTAYNAVGASAASNESAATTLGTTPCQAATIPITVGSTVSGALSTTDCFADVVRPGGHYRDNYGFQAIGGRTYTIDLVSSAFDTYLNLLAGASGTTVLTGDDNSGGGTHARIVYRAPSTGALRIQATSYWPGVMGSYTLSLREGTAPAVPSAPTGLTATVNSQSQITLRWSDRSSNEQGFRIERRTGTGAWGQIAQVGANVVAYANIGLAAGTTYSYRVLAYNAAGVSGYSNEASATTQGGTVAKPAAPTTLVARAASNRQVNLTWRDNANNEAGYRIERKIGTAAWTQIAQVAANATSFANIGLNPRTAYSYRVRAFNAGGTSAYSNAVAVTTPR